MGGHLRNPTYEEVCSGKSGHIEVVQIVFDPDVTPYTEILEVFFAIHDPTTRDRQGNDSGPQYRSAIFYHSDEQREIAEETVGKIEGAVTEVREAEAFSRRRIIIRSTSATIRNSLIALTWWRRKSESSRPVLAPRPNL
jgi:methionine-S-sulfoxide reductase